MRYLFLIFSFLSIVHSQDYKLVVSILDFKGEDVSEKILKASYQRLETSLIQSNRFTVVTWYTVVVRTFSLPNVQLREWPNCC